MPAKDVIHDAVRTALEKDGWTITHDPLLLKYEDKHVLVDLGATRWLLGAERQQEKIAVEIKSFLGPSILHDLESALGQYMIYLAFLRRAEPDRRRYVATSDVAYSLFAESQAIQRLLQEHHVPLVVVQPELQEVVAWIRS
jgi:hypothetical protein